MFTQYLLAVERFEMTEEHWNLGGWPCQSNIQKNNHMISISGCCLRANHSQEQRQALRKVKWPKEERILQQYVQWKSLAIYWPNLLLICMAWIIFHNLFWPQYRFWTPWPKDILLKCSHPWNFWAKSMGLLSEGPNHLSIQKSSMILWMISDAERFSHDLGMILRFSFSKLLRTKRNYISWILLR
jgi:hypothetical protein